jgi:hypothetical protein
MTADDAREFAKHWRTAWNSRTPDEVLGLCAPDVAWNDPLTEARAMAQQLGLLPATGSAAERVAVAAQRITARVVRRVA